MPNLAGLLPRDTWTETHIERVEGRLEISATNEALLGLPMLWQDQHIEIMDLERPTYLKSNVHEVRFGDLTAVTKIATFQWSIPGMENESRVYEAIEDECHRQPSWDKFVPQVIAQLTEHGRTVGVLLQKLNGRYASLRDLRSCEDALRRLHALGIVHGDVNRYNFVVDDVSGHASLLDFEHAELWSAEELAVNANLYQKNWLRRLERVDRRG